MDQTSWAKAFPSLNLEEKGMRFERSAWVGAVFEVVLAAMRALFRAPNWREDRRAKLERKRNASLAPGLDAGRYEVTTESTIPLRVLSALGFTLANGIILQQLLPSSSSTVDCGAHSICSCSSASRYCGTDSHEHQRCLMSPGKW